MNKKFDFRKFVIITLIVSIWVNISEVFRYFIIVMPRVKEFLPSINVAPMNLPVFGIWGLWDTLLTALIVFILWLVSELFGYRFKSILIASLVSWSFFFVLFWVGMVNMNLSSWKLALIALPLAFIEVFLASLIASYLYSRKK